ncbi:hypothetical protein RFI_08595, partial [Reticulomyxa filosa]
CDCCFASDEQPQSKLDINNNKKKKKKKKKVTTLKDKGKLKRMCVCVFVMFGDQCWMKEWKRNVLYCIMTTADARIKDTGRNGERGVEMAEKHAILSSNASTTIHMNTNTNSNMRENNENDGVNRDMNADTAEDGQVDISRLSEWTTNDIITYLSSRCAKFGICTLIFAKRKN